jgi:hypothetical protein
MYFCSVDFSQLLHDRSFVIRYNTSSGILLRRGQEFENFFAAPVIAALAAAFWGAWPQYARK